MKEGVIIIRWSSVSTFVKSVLVPGFIGNTNCNQLGKLKLMCQPRHHTVKLLNEKQNKRSEINNLSNEDDVFLKMRLVKSKKSQKISNHT